MGYKKHLQKRRSAPNAPIPAPLHDQRGIPLPYQVDSPEQLWDDPREGRQVSLGNIAEDVGDLSQSEPSGFADLLKRKLRAYLSEGPDIRRPVPLTASPYKSRRGSSSEDY